MSGWYLSRWPLVVLLIALGAAYMYRFEPLVENRSLHITVVWDRWTHQICVYEFFEVRKLSCSPEALAASSAGPQSNRPVSHADLLRSAGFSTEEINAWVGKEIQSLKSQGVSDAEIEHYLADSQVPKPKGIK